MNSSEQTYVAVLGSHPELARQELQTVAKEEAFLDFFRGKMPALWIGSNWQWKNPRRLPKSREQVLLDQLGGTIRLGKVLGSFSYWEPTIPLMKTLCPTPKGVRNYLGLSSWGLSEKESNDWEKAVTQDWAKPCRLVNRGENPLRSATIFQEKLLKRGVEFLLWKQGKTYTLAQTVASQNLRNYELRDYRKPFRDAKMGMLPPKLAQILLNLTLEAAGFSAENSKDLVPKVYDPFCGSGTICFEAALQGLPTWGADKTPQTIAGAKENTSFLADKFRFSAENSTWEVAEAQTFQPPKEQGIIVTEGWLGPNFSTAPTEKEAQQAKVAVMNLWTECFEQWQPFSQIRAIGLIVPAWKTSQNSVVECAEIQPLVESFGYRVVHAGLEYQRPKALVQRRLWVLKKKT